MCLFKLYCCFTLRSVTAGICESMLCAWLSCSFVFWLCNPTWFWTKYMEMEMESTVFTKYVARRSINVVTQSACQCRATDPWVTASKAWPTSNSPDVAQVRQFDFRLAIAGWASDQVLHFILAVNGVPICCHLFGSGDAVTRFLCLRMIR